MNEIWKDMKGYEGLYEISSLGKVKSLNGNHKILKLSISNKNYLRVCLCVNYIQKKYSIHRLIAINFIPNPDNKPIVNHIDGDKRNNSIDNLEWCTLSENTQHAYDNKLMKPNIKFGESNHFSKLTKEEVLLIREEYENNNISFTKLGKKYDVHLSTISDIIQRKSWKHI